MNVRCEIGVIQHQLTGGHFRPVPTFIATLYLCTDELHLMLGCFRELGLFILYGVGWHMGCINFHGNRMHILGITCFYVQCSLLYQNMGLVYNLLLICGAVACN